MTPSLFDLDPSPEPFHGLEVEPEEARSILRPQKDPVYGFGFTLTPYRGCSHGCRFCYVREYPAPARHQGPGALHDPGAWGRWVAPKVNAPELLWGQRHRLAGQTVFLSSATDPYQPLERDFRLTRRCLEVLLKCPATRVIVHTRSPLVLQDLPLLQAFGPRLSVGFSLATDDDTVRQVVEPAAPAIPSRWAAIERLAGASVAVTLGVAPLLPIRDLAAFVRRARGSGVSAAWVGGLRLLPQDPFLALLRDHGWLHILDKACVAEVREALKLAFPPRRRSRPPQAAPRRPVAPVAQPELVGW
jgi:DNA repair photolyase